MRMTRPVASEEGAVAIIVTLCLTVVVGMTSLVVDVGGLLTTKRTMVSASDSAALAAAQSCALDEGATVATSQADALAQENVSTATQLAAPEYPDGCDGAAGGEVNVAYTTMKELVFAPVLGLPTQTDVPAEATAIWGATGGGVSVPLQVNINNEGVFPCTTEDPERCAMWFDNDPSTTTSSDWGFLSLAEPGWPANVAGNSPDRTCPAASANTNDLRDVILQGGAEVSLVQDPSIGPTYVCARDGNIGSAHGSIFDALIDLRDRNEILLFPVNRPPMISTAGREKYAIIGFVPLTITAVYAGTDETATGTDSDSGICTDRVTFDQTGPNANSTFDAGAVYDICTIDNPPPAEVSETPIVYCGNTTSSPVATLGVDYNWDPNTGIITWLFPTSLCTSNAAPRLFAAPGDNPGGGGGGNPGGGGGGGGGGGNDSVTVTVGFTWTLEAVEGECPPIAVNRRANAFCIIAEFAGPLLTGTNPNPDAPDFGARAIRLSS